MSAISGASRLKTMNERVNSITTSRRWLMPRVRISTIPQEGRLFDSRAASTSLSAHSVSPAKTGFGSLMSLQPRLAAAFSDVSLTARPRTSASVNVETTSGCPNSVRAAQTAVEVHLVRVHRQVREPDVVGLGDGAAEPAPVDVSGCEVLVEATAPLLAHLPPRRSPRRPVSPAPRFGPPSSRRGRSGSGLCARRGTAPARVATRSC